MTESSNVDLGASGAYGSNGATPDSTSRMFGLDVTFRYRPLKRAIYRRFLARTELVWSRRTEIEGPTAFGAYVATDYQFARRWFAGVRLDRIRPRDRPHGQRQWRRRPAHLLAERIQPGPRPVPAHEIFRRSRRQRSAGPVALLHWRARSSCVLDICSQRSSQCCSHPAPPPRWTSWRQRRIWHRWRAK